MLKIEYVAGSRQARLSVARTSGFWLDVRRVCQERYAEVTANSDKVLVMPWWVFLSCREAIAFVLDHHGEDLECDVVAEKMLAQARKNEDLFERLNETDSVAEVVIRKVLTQHKFERSLTPEQMRNVRKLARLDAGATFSVPGAGKTTEAIVFFLLKKSKDTRLLVIAPKNAFAAWEEQFDRCLPKYGKRFVRLTGGRTNIEASLRNDPSMVLITYQQFALVRDLVASHMEQGEWTVFLDESHKVKKGFSGVIGNAVLGIGHLPLIKLIMSGTPMPNDLADLLPQLKFLYPEIEFEIGDLKESINPIYVRTTKAELRLPPIKRVLVPVGMNPAQKKIYELLRSEVAREAEESLNLMDKQRMRQLGKSVLKLIQAASNPALLLRSLSHTNELLFEAISEGDSPKMDYVCERARQLAKNGQKVIIWSVFVENVETIAARLADLGADFIHGGVETGSDEEDDTREARIRNFHKDGNSLVLVANPAACGEGISLHEVCHHAIYLDRNYNAAQYLQSEDRIHRLGLPEGTLTTVEVVVAKDTIDESVGRRLESKVNSMARMLDDRSLNICPIELDVDEDGLDFGDIRDLLDHLSKRG